MPNQTVQNINQRAFPVENRWCVHAYYSLCPYAPDGSGRILVSGVDPDTNLAEVIILSAEGTILERFGSVPATPSFWHTGLWQSWTPDAKAVVYQSGTLRQPRTTRRDLKTGKEISRECDIEGMPPAGEPALACGHGMLYAAGYGGNGFHPELSPVPFQSRSAHGISKVSFTSEDSALVLSTQAILERHPLRSKILEADEEIKSRLGPSDGLTLMTYCVRWNREGSRCLFFFGNHCVVKERREPKITSVFTANRDLSEIHLAIDLSFDRNGVHWSWQADNEHLIGYGPDPENPSQQCLAEVHYTGTGYRKLSNHASGGHPTTSPLNNDLIVTDEGSQTGGNVLFISKHDGHIVQSIPLPKFVGEQEPPGRNPLRICHHPVFNHKGDKVLCNSMPNHLATLVEIQAPVL